MTAADDERRKRLAVDPTRRLPAALVEHARAYLAGGTAPVVPRPAATVVLLRDGSDGRTMESYLLRRHLSMAFAAGMYAFPGGSVDPRDSERVVSWAGPGPAEWAARLECDEPLAQALVCAAVRETFEEAGVLLAGPTASSVVADPTGDDWERDRHALMDHSVALADVLDRRGLVLRSDLLAAWAHWITPEFEPRRYDTWFFVAAMPAGQFARDVSGEADQVCWLPPADAVAGVDSGAMSMLPPTYAALRDLAGFPTAALAAAAAARQSMRPIIPGVEVVGDEGYLTLASESAEPRP